MTPRKSRRGKPSAVPSFIARVGLRRLVITGIIGAVATASAMALAISGIARQRLPDQALRFVPFEGTAIAAQTELLMLNFQAKARANPALARRLVQRSRHALANAPLNPRALRQLAISYELSGNTRKAEALVQLGESLSRRDMIAQLWLIEAGIRANDVDKTLKHYDRALRTNRTASELLFPRLQVAVRNVEIRNALRRYAKAQWMPMFYEYVRVTGVNLASVSDFAASTGGIDPKGDQKNLYAGMVEALLRESHFAEIRRLAVASGDGPHLTSVALFGHGGRQSNGPVGWQMLESQESGGQITVGTDGKPDLMSLFVNAGVTRPLAQRLLYLRPGNYMVSSQILMSSDDAGKQIDFAIRCVEPGKELQLAKVEKGNQILAATFAIDAACAAQMLEIRGFGGAGPSGIDAALSAFELRRTD